MMRRPRSRAASSSGLSGRIAVLQTTVFAPSRASAAWPIRTLAPCSSSRRVIAEARTSDPETPNLGSSSTSASGLIPPADPHEVHRPVGRLKHWHHLHVDVRVPATGDPHPRAELYRLSPALTTHTPGARPRGPVLSTPQGATIGARLGRRRGPASREGLGPMLCSRFLEVSQKHARSTGLRPAARRLDALYRRVLGWTLATAPSAVATLAIVLSSGYFFAQSARTSSEEDDGRFTVSFRAPLGTSRQAMDAVLDDIDQTIPPSPGGPGLVHRRRLRWHRAGQQRGSVRDYGAARGTRRHAVRVPAPAAGRTRADPGRAGVRVGAFAASAACAASSCSSRSSVRTWPASRHCRTNSPAGWARNPNSGVSTWTCNSTLPQIRLEVDRVRAADLGLTSSDVAYAVNMLAGGVDIAKYNDDPGDGDRYDIRVKAADGEITSADDLRRIFVRTPGDCWCGSTPLRTPRTSSAGRDHALRPAVLANFYSNPTIPLGAAVARVRSEAAELLPPGYSMELQGRSREFARTSATCASR